MILLFLLLIPTVALSAPTPTDLRLRLSLYGKSSTTDSSASQLAGTQLEASLQQPLVPALSARIVGNVKAETGSSRARYTDEFRPSQSYKLREALLEWQPLDFLSVRAGAIDQERWGNPLLISRQTFPGFLEGFQKQAGRFTFSLLAQQSVAADASGLQPWGNWPKGLPSFYMERAGLDYTTERWKLGAQISHFLFAQLPSDPASRSRFMGNTVVGIGSNTSAFVYGFQGIETSVRVGTVWRNLSPELLVGAILNTAAPLGHALALRAILSTPWQVSPSWRFIPRAEWFRTESDVTPALFNDRELGHDNRLGFAFSLTANWPNEGVEVSGRWVHAGVLAANPYQSDLNHIQLELRTDYDIL